MLRVSGTDACLYTHTAAGHNKHQIIPAKNRPAIIICLVTAANTLTFPTTRNHATDVLPVTRFNLPRI